MTECETNTDTKNAVAWAEINGKFDQMIQSIVSLTVATLYKSLF